MVEEFSEREGDEKIRSMVDLWPELGLILFRKSLGVMREMSGLSIRGSGDGFICQIFCDV